MAKGKTVEVRRSEARLYVAKADEFLEEARSALESERYDAALLNAIHAAISGTDAVAVALVGRRSTDPDHHRAVDLLEEAAASAPEIRARARQVRALLARKNTVEYESRAANARDAQNGVEQAGRVVDWAREVIAKARL